MRLDTLCAIAASATVIAAGFIMKVPLSWALVSSALVGGGVRLMHIGDKYMEEIDLSLKDCKIRKKVPVEEGNEAVEEHGKKKGNPIAPLYGIRLCSSRKTRESISVKPR